MRKRWLVLGAVLVFLLAAAFSLWLEKPALMQKLSETVTNTVSDKINGTLTFAAMDISPSGHVVITEPVIRDTQGRVVVSSTDMQVYVNPWKLLYSLPGGQAAEAVETIDITAPDVHIWQNQDNTWNVAALVKPSQDKSDPGFRAAVRFHDGTVHARLADNTLITGDNGEGVIDFKDYPRLYGDVSLDIDGEHVSASGHYRSAREFDVLLKGDAVKASYAMPFIPEGTDITVTDGWIRQIRVHYAQTHNGQSFSGSAAADGIAGTAYGLAYDQLQGRVRLSSQSIYLDDVQALVNGQQVKADGEVRIDGDTPVFQLNLNVPGADLSAFADILPVDVSGTSGFTGQLWGSADNLRLQGQVSVHNITSSGLTVTAGRADVAYDGHQVSLQQVSAEIAGGQLSGSGTYDLESGALQAQLKASDIQLEQIPQLPASVVGTVSADLSVQGKRTDNQYTARGHVRAQGLSYNGLEAERAEADIAYDDGLLAIDGLHADVGGGTVTVNGLYDMNGSGTNLSFTADRLPLDIAASYVAMPLAGTVSAAGHVSGPDLDWDLSFHAASGSIQGLAFDSIDGTMTGVGKQIQIPSLVWRYRDGTHTASGTADLDSRQIHVQIVTQHMRLERLLDVLGRTDLALTGWADNTITVSGTLDQPQAQGSFRLSSGSAYGYLYKNVSADYTFANGILYIRNGDISAYDASVKVNGSLGSRLDLNLDASNLDIARLVPQRGPKRSGIMQVKGHLGGTLDQPAFDGSLRAESLVFNDVILEDIRGDVGYHGGIFRLTDFHFKQNDGSYDARGGYNPANGWIMVRASVDNADLASLLKTAGDPVKNVAGRLDGKLSVDGTLERPRAHIQGSLTEGSIGSTPVEPTDIDLDYENDAVQIHKLSLSADGGLLAAEGTYALHGPVKMQIAAHNFPAHLLTDMMGRQDINLDSRIDFVTNLSGTGSQPDADVSLQTGNGTINGVSFSSVYALLNIRNGMIKINQAHVAKDPYQVSAAGTIPVAALTGERTDESMDVTLKLDHAGLDILTFVTPLVADAQGSLEGSLQLKGTLASPLLYGTVGVQDGSVSLKTVRYPLAQIQGQLQFTGQKADFSGSAVMDKPNAKNPGRADMRASLAWDGWQMTQYGGSLILDRLQVECPYYTGPLTGQFTLSPGADVPLLSGTLSLADTTLDLPLGLSDTESSLNMGLDITVSMGDKVRLYNSALYDLPLTGKAHFGGTLAQPMPSGGFSAVNGTIHYLDTNFRVSKAKAEFNQPGTFIPYINLEGETRVGQYGVLLNLRGPAEHMELMLRSNPPLTKNQIISLITLRNSSGRQDSSLDRDDVNSLVGSGIRMTLNSLGITQALEKALNLDMLNITTGSLDYNDKNADISDNYYNIEMGKYLFNDFMLTAAFGLNHNDNRFGMQYNLGSKFGLGAWRSSNDTVIGGMYKYTFY